MTLEYTRTTRLADDLSDLGHALTSGTCKTVTSTANAVEKVANTGEGIFRGTAHLSNAFAGRMELIDLETQLEVIPERKRLILAIQDLSEVVEEEPIEVVA